MARRRGRAAATAAEEDSPAELAPEDWDLIDFIEEVGPTIARVYIYRVLKHGDGDQFIDRVDVETLKAGAEEFLRDTYGSPCKYRLKFKGSDGRWRLSKVVSIGTPDKNFSEGSPISPAGSPSTRDSEVQKQLDLMAARNHELLVTLLANAGKPQAPVPMPDIGALLQSLAQTMNTIKEAATPAAPLSKMTELKEMLELTKLLNPGAAEETGLTVMRDLGNKAIDTFGPILAPRMQAAAQVAAPANGAPGAQPMPTQADWLRAQLHLLKQKALQNKDVTFWIAYIFENDEEPGCAAILDALEQGATFEHVLQFDPEIGQNPTLKVWFKALTDGLLAEIKPNVDPPGSPGNAENPTSHATAGATGGEYTPSADIGGLTIKPPGSQ